jgi:hypothetical protein
MNQKIKRENLCEEIRELIQKFKEKSDGEIKQNYLASLLGISEGTLARAKSPIYNTRIKTLNTIKSDLEELYENYRWHDEKHTPKIEKHKNKKWGMAIFMIITASVIIVLYSYSKYNKKRGGKAKYSYESLTKEYLDSVLGTTWHIKDPNPLLLEKYKDSIFLTIGTEQGDYFTKFNQEHWIEKINNLFYRKIDCGSCCTITLKLSNFHPYQAYQQAGFLLFYSDSITSNRYVRITYSFEGNQPSWTDTTVILPIFHDADSDYFIENGQKHLSPLILPRPYDPSPRTDSIWLRAKIKDNYYSFAYRRNRHSPISFTSLNSGRAFKLDLETQPKILAIGAWQGHSTDHDMNLPLVDVIPATFENLVIIPCDD